MQQKRINHVTAGLGQVALSAIAAVILAGGRDAQAASLNADEVKAALCGTWVPAGDAAGQVQAVVEWGDTTVTVCGLMSSTEGKRYHSEVSSYSIEGNYMKWQRKAQCTSDGASPAQFVDYTVESSVYVYKTADGAVAFSWPGLDLYTRVRDGKMSITTPDGALVLERKAGGAAPADPAAAAAVGAWLQAWKLGALKGIMSWYDSDYRTGEGEGLAAVEEWYRGLLAEGMNERVKLDDTKLALAPGAPDRATVSGLLVETPEGDRFRLTFDMRRRDAGWRIADVEMDEVY